MKVQIAETATGIIIAVDEIHINGFNYAPEEKEYFDIAWQNLVNDGLVNNNDRDKFTISFV